MDDKHKQFQNNRTYPPFPMNLLNQSERAYYTNTYL